MLERLAADTNDSVLHTCFAIFDERSLQDGSVLLVQTVDDVLEGMRCVPEIALGKLLQYMIGDADITEDREEAEEEQEDGVYRMNDEYID